MFPFCLQIFFKSTRLIRMRVRNISPWYTSAFGALGESRFKNYLTTQRNVEVWFFDEREGFLKFNQFLN